MNPNTVISLDLTNEELGVLLALAQLGVKACQGEQFDVASGSYVHLRGKIIAAQKAALQAEPASGRTTPPAANDAEGSFEDAAE